MYLPTTYANLLQTVYRSQELTDLFLAQSEYTPHRMAEQLRCQRLRRSVVARERGDR